MYENHPFTRDGACPCRIGEEVVRQTAEIYRAADDVAAFVEEMERRRVIGRRIWYDAQERTIFIEKVYPGDSNGSLDGQSLVEERCHCSHYHDVKTPCSLCYCKCGAEFYRPMFAPIWGEQVWIEPWHTVLAGNDTCILAIRIDKTEDEYDA
ncbi:MAG: hypothetical protein VB086_11950 [Clostridiaceae bacterium]|nr:hypothetical protein [Clostridiaceae bacterium]